MSRPLGSTQLRVLEMLVEFGSWHENGRWIWTNTSGTVRVLNTLLRNGLATTTKKVDPKTGTSYDVYLPTPQGIKIGKRN